MVQEAIEIVELEKEKIKRVVKIAWFEKRMERAMAGIGMHCYVTFVVCIILCYFIIHVSAYIFSILSFPAAMAQATGEKAAEKSSSCEAASAKREMMYN